MLGRLEFGRLKRKDIQVETLYGLLVLRARTDPTGWLGEHRLKRAGRALERGGAMRTLVPPEFARWDLLEPYGLSPVDPVPFLRAQSAPLALGALERRGVAPDRATVALRGRRVDPAMARAAVQLCPRVRRLVIAAPRGGERFAHWLRWEFGVPVLPAEEKGQVALCLQPCERVEEATILRLYGPEPELAGLRLRVPELAEGDREDLFLLSALWEGGCLGRNALKIT